MDFVCRKCGSTDLFTRKQSAQSTQIGLYCSNCGAWQKWVNKKEAALFEQQEQESRSVIHEKEKRLIEIIRRLGHGELVIKVQDGLPVMVEKITEKIRL